MDQVVYTPPPRKPNGQFEKGFSGRRYGKSVGDYVVADASEQLKEAASIAVDVLLKMVMSPKTSDTARVKAAIELLNRSVGKPANVNYHGMANQQNENASDDFDVSTLSLDARREIMAATLIEHIEDDDAE